jgi:hypothetical protein
MAGITKVERNQILADVVQGWAREHQVTDDPYIVGLTRALTENKNLAMWSSVDPLVTLPYPKSNSQNSLLKVFRRINMFRNALVFAPVAVTWLAVGQATSAFQEFVEKNSTSTVNFLEFWQNGYDVLGSEWRISRVATADFVIVLVVILLTIFSNYLGEIVRRRQSEEEIEISRDRTELALAIKEYLFTKQTISRLTLNQGVATAIENLVSATENLQKPRRRTSIKKRK